MACSILGQSLIVNPVLPPPHPRRKVLAQLLRAGAGAVGTAGLAGWAEAADAAVAADAAEEPTIEALQVAGAQLELQFDPAFAAPERNLMRRWIAGSATTVAQYFGRFPLAQAEVLIQPAPRPGVNSGAAFAEPTPYLRLRVGPNISATQLGEDWVLAHEMVHLALPRLAPQHAWFHEGVATYVEAVARCHVGLINPVRLWGGLAAGMSRGQPFAGDRGLDHTPTWGRTYWGGAMFCLLADVQILQRTGGRLGLRQALRGVLDAGGDYTQSWPLQRVLASADAAVGQTCLTELHALMKDTATVVDMDGLWRDMGVYPRAMSAATLRPTGDLVWLRRRIEADSES